MREKKEKKWRASSKEFSVSFEIDVKAVHGNLQMFTRSET